MSIEADDGGAAGGGGQPSKPATLPAPPAVLAALFAEYPDAVIHTDLDRRIVACNRSTCRVFEYEEHELIGQSIRVLYEREEDFAEQGKQRYAATGSREDRTAYDMRYRTRGGRPFWGETIGQVVRDDDGRPFGFLGIIRDTTRRRRWNARRELFGRMGAELQASRAPQQRLEAAARIAVDTLADACAVYVIADDGRITLAAAAHRVAAKESLIHRSFAARPLAADAPIGYASVIRSGAAQLVPRVTPQLLQSLGGDPEQRQRDQEMNMRSLIGVPLLLNGTAIGALMLAITEDDVSFDPDDLGIAEELGRRLVDAFENARLDQETARQRDRFVQVQEASPDGFVLLRPVWGSDGAIVDFEMTFQNEAASRTNGVPREQAVGRRLLDLFPGVAGSEWFVRYVRVFESAVADTWELRYGGQGVESWFRTTVAKVGDELAVSFADITSRKQVEQRLDILSRATAALTSSLDQQIIVTAVAELTVPALADWCAIDLIEDDGRIRRAAVAHPDPVLRDIAMGWWDRFSLREGMWLRRIVDNREVTGILDLTDDLLASHIDADKAALLRHLGARQCITVPIGTREHGLGTLSVIMAQSARRFVPADVDVVAELGTRIAVALDNARLFTAEKAARDRMERLAQLTAALSSAITPGEVAAAACRLGADAMGAQFGVLWLLTSDGGLQLAASHGLPDQALRDWQVIAPGREAAALRTARTGEALWMSSQQDLRQFTPNTADAAVAVGIEASVIVPLGGSDRVRGVLTISYAAPQTFSPSTRAFFQTIAGHCGQALERALLLESETQAKDRLATLARTAEQAARRAEEAGRVKDEFLATVSHELRTPLHAILGWSNILRRDRTLGPGAHKGLAVIERNANAQARIIDDILDVSRIISGKLKLEPRPIDLGAIVRQAVDVVRPSATAKQIALVINEPPEPMMLVADPDRLQQVAWNLLSNAVKFTPRDGLVSVMARQQGTTVTLEVSDTGQGIPADFLPAVFERFRQADSSTTRHHGGLGLGLAIVRHIVELHGGHVTAFSAGTDQGSTFKVVLPVRAVAPAPELEEGVADESDVCTTEAPPGDLRGTRVLLVDDEADARDLLNALLVEAGADVVTAASVAEALEAVAHAHFDVLVSDVGMPGRDGYELIRSIRARPSRHDGAMPAVALTAYTRPEDRRKAIEAGFTTHLAKPVDPALLVATIANLSALTSGSADK